MFHQGIRKLAIKPESNTLIRADENPRANFRRKENLLRGNGCVKVAQQLAKLSINDRIVQLTCSQIYQHAGFDDVKIFANRAQLFRHLRHLLR